MSPVKKFACQAAGVLNHASELYERDALGFEVAADAYEGASFTPAAGVTIPAAGAAQGLALTYGASSFVSSIGAGLLTGFATGNFQPLANTALGFGLGKAAGLKGPASSASGIAGNALANAATPNPCG